MSNKICCVPGCPNSIGAGETLHKFPNPAKDKDLFDKWVFSIGGDIRGLENDHIFKYRRVCRAHFEPKYWCRNNRLSNIAVPTKNMPDDTTHKFPHPNRFPDQFKAWCKIITGNADTVLDHNLIVCDRHFTDSNRNRNNRLNALAVPSLFLPDHSRASLLSETMTRMGTAHSSASSHRTLHLFPNPEKNRERFNKWVFLIKGDIVGLHDEDIYKHRSVCHAHFEEKYCCRYNKLSNIAVPTLKLPAPVSLPKFTWTERRPMRQIQECSIDIPSTSVPSTTPSTSVHAPIILAECSAGSKGQSIDISPTNSPGPPASLEPKYTDMEHMETECSETESAGNKICEEIETETVDAAPTAFEFVSTTVPPPSKPFRADVPEDVTTERGNYNCAVKSLYTQLNTRPPRDTVPEPTTNGDTCFPDVESTNACSMIDASTQTEVLDDVQLMTTQISRMNQEIKDLRKELRRSKICIWKRNKRIKFLKGRLDTSGKNFNQNILEKVTKKMTPAAKVFTTMQYTQTSRRNKGRRFTHEEKVLSMSMYKSSPTGYALLSNIFTLPSVTVINKYWTEVQNEVRISEELNSINQLDHTTTHDDDDATASPVTHADNDDTFVPDVDFNQLDHVIGDDNDNMSQNPVICSTNDKTLVAEDNSNQLYDTVGDEYFNLTQNSVICYGNGKKLVTNVNSNQLDHITGDRNSNLKQIPVKRLIKVDTIANKVNPNDSGNITGDHSVNLKQKTVKRLINVQTLANNVYTNNSGNTAGGCNVNLKQIPVKRVRNVKTLDNNVGSTYLDHTTGDLKINVSKAPAKRKNTKILRPNVNLKRLEYGTGANLQYSGDRSINLTQVPVKRIKKFETFVPEVNSTIEIGSGDIQIHDVGDNNSCQRTLDMALEGLTYDMPELG